jgi:hypothetical protein
MRMLLSLLSLVLPWRLRRHALMAVFGYKIHRSARIGFSIICPQRLEMGPGACIGSLTMCKGISLLKMDEASFIGNLNWITGFPANDKTFFGSELERRPENGFVIEPDNPIGMACFMQLLATDETLWRRMSIASREYAEKADTEHFADAVEALLFTKER